MSFLTVLPLAFVMIAGPQIIAAILLATGDDARRNSLAFHAGVSFRLGLLLFLVMPTDIITMLTVGPP